MTHSEDVSRDRLAVLSLAALGVVYGDIGTSPLYALRESLNPAEHGLALNEGNVLGVLSLIVWSLVLLVAVKYVTILLRADNDGEGGILALTTLVSRSLARDNPKRRIAVVLGLFGAALLYGDGLITPAISNGITWPPSRATIQRMGRVMTLTTREMASAHAGLAISITMNASTVIP